MKLASFLIAVLLSATALADYFVSPTGSDSTGTGTSALPFETLAFAVNVAATNSVSVIRLKSGSYYNTEATVGSGNPGLTIRADDGASPILYGGQVLSGWSTNGAYQEAVLPAFPSSITNMTQWEPRELLVDGVRIPRARFPDYGSWLFYVPSNNNSSILGYTGTDIPNTLVVTNAELEVKWTWDAGVQQVTGLDTVGKTISLYPPGGHNYGFNSTSNYAILNTVDGMHPGYWYHDRVNGKIIVQTNSLAGHVVLIPTTSKIIQIQGLGGFTNYAENITISGLTLSLTTASIFASPVLMGGLDYPGAIHGLWTSNLTVTNCTVTYTGGSGIHSSTAYSLHMNIANNTVTHVGAAGIGSAAGATGSIVLNTVQGAGEVFVAGVGIYNVELLQGLPSLVISNVVSDTSYAGIISSKHGSGGTIIGNTVSNTLINLDDGGDIYTFAATNLTVIGNTCYGSTGTSKNNDYGIYLDAGSTSCLVVSNLVVGYGTPFLVNIGTNNAVTNNFFIVSTGAMQPKFSGGANCTVQKNIFDYGTSFSSLNTGNPPADFSDNTFYSPLGSSGVPAGGIFANPSFSPPSYKLAPIFSRNTGIAPIFGLLPYIVTPLVRAGQIRTP